VAQMAGRDDLVAAAHLISVGGHRSRSFLSANRADDASPSAVTIAVQAVAVGAERMKLVVSTETECPAGAAARARTTAAVAAEAPIGPRRIVQGGDHLLEVLSQCRQLLGELVQGRLGRRRRFDRRVLVHPLSKSTPYVVLLPVHPTGADALLGRL
jgi:hypothetical protein